MLEIVALVGFARAGFGVFPEKGEGERTNRRGGEPRPGGGDLGHHLRESGIMADPPPGFGIVAFGKERSASFRAFAQGLDKDVQGNHDPSFTRVWV